MRPNQSLKALPDFVRCALFNPKTFLVGSACYWLLGERQDTPKDFDVIVDPQEFQSVCRSLTNTAVAINSFGGLKIVGPPSIDVIPLSLADFILQCDGNIAIRLSPFKVIRWVS